MTQCLWWHRTDLSFTTSIFISHRASLFSLSTHCLGSTHSSRPLHLLLHFPLPGLHPSLLARRLHAVGAALRLGWRRGFEWRWMVVASFAVSLHRLNRMVGRVGQMIDRMDRRERRSRGEKRGTREWMGEKSPLHWFHQGRISVRGRCEEIEWRQGSILINTTETGRCLNRYSWVSN